VNIRATLACAALACAATPAFGHDFSFKGIEIGHPSATPTVAAAKTGAVYIALHNKTQRVEHLVSARTPRAKRVEIHATTMSGDVARMREADSIELKPGAQVRMRPGSGYHLMLVDLDAPLKAGERFPLTLQFRTSGSTDVEVVVEAAKPAAKAEHHH